MREIKLSKQRNFESTAVRPPGPVKPLTLILVPLFWLLCAFVLRVRPCGDSFWKTWLGLLEPAHLQVPTLKLNICLVSSPSLSFFLHPLPGFFRHPPPLNKSLVYKSSAHSLLLGNRPTTCIFLCTPKLQYNLTSSTLPSLLLGWLQKYLSLRPLL